MTCCDSRGLPISTGSEQAAAFYREGVDLLLSAWPQADARLDDAIAADPDLAVARAAQARLHAIRGESAAARAAIGEAVRIGQANATDRERSHIATIAFAVTGQPAKALEAALAHLDVWPHDVVIMSLPLGAFGLLAFSGRADHNQARVDLCERHARHFADDDWWFLGVRGWAHVENGTVPHGRRLTERALSLRRANANAAHALSHAMFEAGAAAEAEAYIADWLPSYDRTGIMHGHIAWHAALAALERGDPAGALAIYTENVQPSVTHALPLNVVSDSVSLLWRLKAYGHEVPTGLWEAAWTYASGFFDKAGHAFVDVHMGLLAAATGDTRGATVRIDALVRLVEAGTLAAGPVVPAICRAALAFAERDYELCARILEPAASEVVRIGGSGAQREIVEDTLLQAFIRDGQTEKARVLLENRLHRRPSHRDMTWYDAIRPAENGG
ncbi:MAG: tetratricopeptide repeat protein [Hyphomicrobiales bacterium]|nr:MAG: tetratricopeptide repeat protein [Hyphomicrobiales bacterium]